MTHISILAFCRTKILKNMKHYNPKADASYSDKTGTITHLSKQLIPGFDNKCRQLFFTTDKLNFIFNKINLFYLNKNST